MQSSTGFSDSGDHVSSGASWLPKPVAPSCTHGYGDSAEGFMHVDEPSVIAKNKVDHVKRLQEVIERTFRGLMGDIEEAPTLTPLESVEGVRYNAEQDIQDLVSAHTDFEQFFNRKRLIYSHHHPEKLLEARLKDMKKAIVRKDYIIQRHHRNLENWSAVLKTGLLAQPSSNDPSLHPPQPIYSHSDPSLLRQNIPRPNLAMPPGMGQQAMFNPQPLQAPSSFSYGAPSPQNYGPGMVQGGPYLRQQAPQHRPQGIPGAQYGIPRSQMSSGFPAQNIQGLQFGSRVSPAPNMMQAGPNQMMQPHPMRAPSPNIASPVSYGQIASPRMQWRPNVPIHQQPHGFPVEEAGEMYNQPGHGAGPNVHPASQ